MSESEYALLLAQPILGLLQTSAHGDQTSAHGDHVNLFFLGQLPPLIENNRPLARLLLTAHKSVGFLLLGLVSAFLPLWEITLVLSALLLAHSLVRDIAILLRSRRSASTGLRKEAHCFCLELTAGSIGIVAGAMLAGFAGSTQVEIRRWDRLFESHRSLEEQGRIKLRIQIPTPYPWCRRHGDSRLRTLSRAVKPRNCGARSRGNKAPRPRRPGSSSRHSQDLVECR